MSINCVLRLSIGIGTCVLFTHCAGPSIRSDLEKMRDLSHVQLPATLENASIEPATSQDVEQLLSEPLSADSAVRIAIANNRNLRASLRELGISRGQYIQASLIANPEVEFEALPERDSLFEFRVEYNVSSLILAPLRRKASRFDLEAVRYKTAATLIENGFEVRRAFYAAQAAESRFKIAQQTLDAFAADRDAAQALLKAGNIPELDLANREAAYQQARLEASNLELDVMRTHEKLNRLLGLFGKQTAWQIAGQLTPAPQALDEQKDTENRAIAASLELQEVQSRLQALSRRIGVTRTEGWLPAVNVDFHLLSGNPNQTNRDSNLRYGGGVGLALPIFDRKQGQVRAGEAEFDGLQERYYGLAIDIRSSAREARAQLAVAHARARHYEQKLLPAQKKVLEQTQLQYNAMQIGIFELLRANRELLQVELGYINSLRDYWTATAAFEAILAGKRVDQEPSFQTTSIDQPSTQGGH